MAGVMAAPPNTSFKPKPLRGTAEFLAFGMRKVLKKLACIALLLVVAGFCIYALLGGLMAGAIDDPARGANEIKVALDHFGFWLMAAAYLVAAVVSSVAAYRFTQDA